MVLISTWLCPLVGDHTFYDSKGIFVFRPIGYLKPYFTYDLVTIVKWRFKDLPMAQPEEMLETIKEVQPPLRYMQHPEAHENDRRLQRIESFR